MSDKTRSALGPTVSGRHARLPGPAGLRRGCQVTLIALVAQFSLGMVLNLYVSVPSSDQHAGFIQEIKTAPAALTAHALLGLVLIGAAGVMAFRAFTVRDRLMIALSATGLAAIGGAFAAGEIFVKNGQNSTSLWMAILTGVALVCYISALGRAGAFAQQVMRLSPGPARFAGPAGMAPAGMAPAGAALARPAPAGARGPAGPVRPDPSRPDSVPLPRRNPYLSGPQPGLGYPPMAERQPPSGPARWPAPAGYRPAGRPPAPTGRPPAPTGQPRPPRRPFGSE